MREFWVLQADVFREIRERIDERFLAGHFLVAGFLSVLARAPVVDIALAVTVHLLVPEYTGAALPANEHPGEREPLPSPFPFRGHPHVFPDEPESLFVHERFVDSLVSVAAALRALEFARVATAGRDAKSSERPRCPPVRMYEYVM